MRDRYRRRQSTFGSFFSGTSGILLAAFTFFVGVPIAICGGCSVWFGVMSTQVEVARQQEETRTGSAEKKALQALASYGVTEFEKGVYSDRTGSRRTVRGRAKAGKEVVSVEVIFDVTEFQNEVRWEVVSLTIDGEFKEGTSSPSGKK